jgi:Tfp pilus assembly protein PilZ
MRPARKDKRIVKRLETEFSVGASHFRGISSVLSESGLFLRTSKPFSAGTPVDLTIHLPGNMVARLKGIVRWASNLGQMSGKNGMGIEIIESDKSYVDFLNTLLPPGEQAQHKENRNAEPAPADPKSEPAALPKSEQDAKEGEIDSMISSLFPKRKEK